jgi:prepilin-type processing-associated H-X9-DG protein
MTEEVRESLPVNLSPRTSRLAIASFVMGLVSLVICVLWPVLALPAIICGIVALVKISGSNGSLKGKGYAITGIILPAVMAILLPFLAMFAAIMMPALVKARDVAQRTVCLTNLNGLGAAMTIYANDNNGQLSPADRWCDLLISKGSVSPKMLLCPDSDAVEGESSYAMNINAAGKKLDQLPPDMVLLFETDAGKEAEPRTEIINTRASHPVYPKRWNQAGGPEIMQAEHEQNGQPGCNVLFVDGHAAFICGDELQKLRWTADKP